ncbi:hypothetical protein GJU39_22220 [Pedobacter petrophilus]|uniref:BT4734-like N-terminal domain-containing protein n=1 Tax=Pedobacter petrophilus TaxID=1908241 RepID=A0A7K0G733_9SPHI|nr:BT4734/BF3469 family protein [Pedobacter petrophilus]MRX78796.1 hypothetical protein [Pedobacter petrophilus]
MTLEEIRSQPVAFQYNSWSGITRHLTVGQSLDMIKNGTYKKQVDRLRGYLAAGDRDTYDQEKRKLPAVTFAADFTEKRKRQSIAVYNGLCVLDIDKLTAEQLEQVKMQFADDPYVFTFWESPSMAGVKGLVHFEFPADTLAAQINFHHTYGFRKIYDYFLEKYGIALDTSGSDVTRLCFFSHDPLLFLQDKILSFPIVYSPEEITRTRESIKSAEYTYSAEATMDQKFNPKGKNSQSSRARIQAIIRFLTKRNLSITSSFQNWYEIGYAMANIFTHELALKYYLALSKMDGKAFDETACKNMLEYCFANSMGRFSFGTIIFYAKKVGYGEEIGVPKVAEKS